MSFIFKKYTCLLLHTLVHSAAEKRMFALYTWSQNSKNSFRHCNIGQSCAIIFFQLLLDRDRMTCDRATFPRGCLVEVLREARVPRWDQALGNYGFLRCVVGSPTLWPIHSICRLLPRHLACAQIMSMWSNSIGIINVEILRQNLYDIITILFIFWSLKITC